MNQNITFPVVFKTSDDVEKHIKIGSTKESLYLEFKKEILINHANKHLASEIASDICQFANSFGGSIIIGIKESNNQNEFKTAEGYINVTNVDEIRQYLNDVVATLVYPTTAKLFECEPITMQTSETLFTINIKPIEYGAASISSKSEPEVIKYPYRTDYGKKYMNPDQVMERIMNSNRSIVIRLNRLKNTCINDSMGTIIDLLSPIYDMDDGSRKITNDFDVYLVDIRESEFKMKFSDKKCGVTNGITLTVPYSLIDHLWQTDQNKIGMVLSVNILINRERGICRFEPLAFTGQHYA